MPKHRPRPDDVEIITRTNDLRERIAAILSPQSGRRVAIVAFVGGDALGFAPEPSGLEVYCWPNRVATNPDGVRALLNHGAKVYFLDRLHMKAYWSERGGCLIGSPNLSANALDETTTGLYEIGWYSRDSTLLDIDMIIRRLHQAGAYLADDAALAKLEKEHTPAHPDSAASKSAGPIFGDYLAALHPKRFKIISWKSTSPNTRAEIIAGSDYYEEATGRSPRSTGVIDDSIMVEHGTKDGTWILACKIKDDDAIGKLSWIFAHHVVKARSNARYETALAIRGLYIPEPPFDISSDYFQDRFSRYASDQLPSEFDRPFNIIKFKNFESRNN